MGKPVLFLWLVVASSADAAFDPFPVSGRVVSMGGASTALKNDPWAAFSNPAALPTVAERMISLMYSPQPFGLKELARGALTFVEPTSIGAFALSGTRYGFDVYREVTASLSYAHEAVEGIRWGINLSYYSLAIVEYGSAATMGIGVGVLVDLTQSLTWGFNAHNINRPSIGAVGERLPQMFAVGLGYQPIPRTIIALDVVKDVRYPASMCVGVEYMVLDLLTLRAGTASEPATMHAGLGLEYSLLRLDYAFSSHQQLGLTHQASLSIRLGDL